MQKYNGMCVQVVCTCKKHSQKIIISKGDIMGCSQMKLNPLGQRVLISANECSSQKSDAFLLLAATVVAAALFEDTNHYILKRV